VRAERPARPHLRQQPVRRPPGNSGGQSGGAGAGAQRGGLLPQRLGGNGNQRVGPRAVGGGAAGGVSVLRVHLERGRSPGRRVPVRAVRRGGVLNGARGAGVRPVRRGGLLDGAGVHGLRALPNRHLLLAPRRERPRPVRPMRPRGLRYDSGPEQLPRLRRRDVRNAPGCHGRAGLRRLRRRAVLDSQRRCVGGDLFAVQRWDLFDRPRGHGVRYLHAVSCGEVLYWAGDGCVLPVPARALLHEPWGGELGNVRIVLRWDLSLDDGGVVGYGLHPVQHRDLLAEGWQVLVHVLRRVRQGQVSGGARAVVGGSLHAMQGRDILNRERDADAGGVCELLSRHLLHCSGPARQLWHVQ
jgi:hypothetical protein